MTPSAWLKAVNAANAASAARVLDRVFQYLGAIHEVWRSVDKGLNNLYVDYRDGRKATVTPLPNYQAQKPVQPYQPTGAIQRQIGSATDRAAFIRAVGRPPYSLDELEKFMWEDG